MRIQGHPHTTELSFCIVWTFGFRFGANNTNQSTSLFGGGQQNRPGGFGTTNTNTGGSLFGNTSGTGATGGFGSSTGGGFGSGTTGGAFGSSTNTGGGLFGANKPAGGFGSGTGGGFGSGTTGSAFGSTPSTGFGGAGTALSGGAVPPCDGTGSTPFNPFTEKDTNSSIMNHYQSINFMQPYQKYSFEELRLADYERGRRYGNGSNQAGAFGNSNFGSTGTGFGTQQNTGGFGSGTTPFGGANTSTPSAFGGATQTTGGFGAANNSTSLLGVQTNLQLRCSVAARQPHNLAVVSLVVAQLLPALAVDSEATQVLEAPLAPTPTPEQNKPAFGGTGTSTTGFGGSGFGTQQNTTNSNPFGGGTTSTSTPFGQQQQTGTSAFGGGLGASQNQTQNKPLFGGGGGFGTNNQQQQGSSLFGGGTQTQQPAPGGGLFGGGTQNQQQNTGSSLFGGNQSQQASGVGLFGGQNQQQQKPGGLFGGGTGTTGSAFGGLGSSQTQQPAGGGLFGGQNQQQQKPGGLFGGSTGGTGGGLFGQANNTQQNTGSSLFGGQSQQQQQPASSSLFGGSQPAPQQSQPAPGSLTTSLLGGNPYGSQSIFSGLPAPEAPSPGPLATPLSSSMKQKQRAPLPYSITPNGASRLSTPPKRQGYGFSYSTYGSPSSSSSTPNGFSNSLLGGAGSNSLRGSIGGSFGRSFSKSYSTSNLRKTFDPESDSVLSPGALQSSGGRGNGGSIKRLTIDRSLRTDLFARSASNSPATITNGDDSAQSDKLKKKVSFDSTPTSNEVVRVESKSPDPTPQELGFLRSQRRSGSLNGIDGSNNERPEMESISRDLAVVPENGEPIPAGSSSVKRLAFVPGSDPKPGEYWMKPSRAEISRMSRDQLKQVMDFTVGRQHCGSVTFNGAVDLTTVDLDNLYGRIVDIGVRKITVYPDEAVKPPMGKGLNVVSTLRIENSWPRGRDRKSPLPITSGPLFDKHIDRLQKVQDTEFLDYETETGTWVFQVPHFTTYGLDYDEDEEDESLNQSALGAGPVDNRTPKAQPDHPASFEQSATFSIDESFVGSMAGVDDDTFDFKKRKLVPGSFSSQAMDMEDEEMGSEGETESFLEEGSTGSATEQDDDVTESQRSGDSVVGSDGDQEMDMAGSFPDLHRTVEREESQSTDGDLETTHPVRHFGTPPKPRLDLSGDWAEQLQRTISPRKQNRDALREIQANAFTDRPLLNEGSSEPKLTGSPKKGFSNSIDLMNSLFQQPRKQNAPSPLKASKMQPKGFEWPYNKQPKTFAGDTTEMDQADAAFHDSFKPRWGPMDSLICAKNDMADPISDIYTRWQESFSVFSEQRDIAVMKSNQTGQVRRHLMFNPLRLGLIFAKSKGMLDLQQQQSTVARVDGTPFVRLSGVDLRQFAFAPSKDEERLVWQLVNILFNDDIEDDISAGVPPQLRQQFAHRIKKDRLTRLWQNIIRERHSQSLDFHRSAEERAVYLLCSHRVEEACKTLVESGNPHLATLVAQIGRDATSQADMARQIKVWGQNNILAEMSEPVRALYDLVAGNGLRSEGKSGGALEDRASTFIFSERFELDWFQAFGLRLWYSTTEDEPIEAAVSKFLDDLDTGLEPAFPHPSHRASCGSPQPGSDTLGRESPLWVLLKTYAAVRGHKNVPPLELPAAILPESLSGNRLTNRLSFQLHYVLTAAIGPTEAIKIDQYQADRLAWDFASENIANEEFCAAIFVLLHLSQADDRKRAVQDTLARFGASLPDPTTSDGTTTDPVWEFLVGDFQLPEAWIWVAKALYARASGDAIREVDALIRGKHWNDAHATFCRVVGPTAIISRDYATLDKLITGFGDGPERKMRGWSSGGGIYEDFLRLATATRGRRDPTRLSRLVNALVAKSDHVRNGSGMDGLEERVAFKEMSRAVASWTTHENTVEASKMLGLPLTGDARVMQTVEMSRRYFGIIMAGGY
ncbi:hypothetical protein N7532_008322 [Penicillium argentinense]|uniref:Peptidase S59 domain-containing protein n=1 Tax=Penicillium argentinense TaxID=1131581 RepID=A0A9W9K1I2_9EURO|nr:uncharacterized protein N7532_008322 [Penicillium argentinense]KAJ5089638.1 hypothetical protein N7532_008322 [Penicillium argentinense]